MNDDLALALDNLLYYLDSRYTPVKKRTMGSREYNRHWENDKIEFRKLTMVVLEQYTGVERSPATLPSDGGSSTPTPTPTPDHR